jgi:hypothetical protein
MNVLIRSVMCFLLSICLHFLDFSLNGILWCLLLFVWLLSLSISISVTHVVIYVNNLFLLMLSRVSLHGCGIGYLATHPLKDIWAVWGVLIITNKALKNIHTWVLLLVCAHFSWVSTQNWNICIMKGRGACHSLKTGQAPFHSGTFPLECMWVPSPSHPGYHFGVILLVLAVLVSVWQYLMWF